MFTTHCRQLRFDRGNDGLNTVYPITDGPTNQRTLYEEYRPTLGLPDTNGGVVSYNGSGFQSVWPDATSVLPLGANADGAQYALHPAMTAMHGLYQAGKLAVVNSVHYPFPDHSHLRSDEIWNNGDPLGAGAVGWFGKYLDYAGFGPTEVPCVNQDESIKPLFTPANTSIFAYRRLSDLQFAAAGESTLKRDKFLDLYAEAAASDPGFYPELRKIGETGIATVNTMELYYKPGAGSSGKVVALRANVAVEDDVSRLMDFASEQLGGHNGLINNAGIFRDGLTVKKDRRTGEIRKMSLDNWKAVIDIDLTGPFLCTREFAARVIAADTRPAVIVNMSSAARHGNRGQANYSGSTWPTARRARSTGTRRASTRCSTPASTGCA